MKVMRQMCGAAIRSVCAVVSDVNDHTIVRFERHCERLVQ